jgi:hypothetical protein
LALFYEEADLLNSRGTHAIENFGKPDIPRPDVGSDINLSLRALVDAFPNFEGQLIGVYYFLTEKDSVVTSNADDHGVFPSRVRH